MALVPSVTWTLTALAKAARAIGLPRFWAGRPKEFTEFDGMEAPAGDFRRRRIGCGRGLDFQHVGPEELARTAGNASIHGDPVRGGFNGVTCEGNGDDGLERLVTGEFQDARQEV